MKSININEMVRVKLTLYAETKYQEYWRGFTDHSLPLQKDEEGYTEFQMWEFMHIFGPYLFNGSHQIIKENRMFFPRIDE